VPTAEIATAVITPDGVVEALGEVVLAGAPTHGHRGRRRCHRRALHREDRRDEARLACFVDDLLGKKGN